MQVAILIVVMIIVGAVIGALAGRIFKGEPPKGSQGDYIAAILTTIIVGLLDWYVIPWLGFTRWWTIVGVIIEPPLAALLVLWLMRKANE